MKKIMILLVLLIVSVQSKDSLSVNGDQMTQWIRARGTFVVSLVDLNVKLDTSKADTSLLGLPPAPINPNASPEDQQKAKDLQAEVDAFAEATKALPKEYDLYTNDKIELPLVCNPKEFPDKPFIKNDKLTSIAQGGAMLKTCWVQSAGVSGDIDYLSLPNLNAKSLANFYQCASNQTGNKIDPAFILPADGIINPDALMTVATFGDFNRDDISWLEMWVYMCTKGVQPKESYYLAKDADSLKQLLKVQGEAKAQQIANKQKGVSKGVLNAVAPKKTKRLSKNKKTNVVFSYSQLQKLAKLNSEFESQSKYNRKIQDLIEKNANIYNNSHKFKNNKDILKMKLNQKSHELASGIQQMMIRAQDPELLNLLKKHKQKLRLRQSKKSKKKHVRA